MSRFAFKVEAYRKVAAPIYGSDAYRISSKAIKIPFGKNTRHKTGKSALKEAEKIAEQLKPLSSDITIFRMNGGFGSGQRFHKSDEIFAADWDSIERESM